MLKASEQLGARMYLKINFLHSHLEFFPPKLGDASNKQGERFHQDISVVEKRFHCLFHANMMSDFYWDLQRECNGLSYKRKARCTK